MAIAACAYWDSLACRDWPVCGYRGGRLRRGHVVDIWTRPAAVPLVIHIAVAILSTKIALYFGTSPLPKPAAPPFSGWWAVLHESRSDYAQLLTSLYLVIAGPKDRARTFRHVARTIEGTCSP